MSKKRLRILAITLLITGILIVISLLVGGSSTLTAIVTVLGLFISIIELVRGFPDEPHRPSPNIPYEEPGGNYPLHEREEEHFHGGGIFIPREDN